MLNYFKKVFYGHEKPKPVIETPLEISNKVELILLDRIGESFEKSEILDEKHIMRDLCCDGLDVMEIIMELDSYYNISIQEGAFELTVGSLKDYVGRKIRQPDYLIPESEVNWEETGWGFLAKTIYAENNRQG